MPREHIGREHALGRILDRRAFDLDKRAVALRHDHGDSGRGLRLRARKHDAEKETRSHHGSQRSERNTPRGPRRNHPLRPETASDDHHRPNHQQQSTHPHRRERRSIDAQRLCRAPRRRRTHRAPRPQRSRAGTGRDRHSRAGDAPSREPRRTIRRNPRAIISPSLVHDRLPLRRANLHAPKHRSRKHHLFPNEIFPDSHPRDFTRSASSVSIARPKSIDSAAMPSPSSIDAATPPA